MVPKSEFKKILDNIGISKLPKKIIYEVFKIVQLFCAFFYWYKYIYKDHLKLMITFFTVCHQVLVILVLDNLPPFRHRGLFLRQTSQMVFNSRLLILSLQIPIYLNESIFTDYILCKFCDVYIIVVHHWLNMYIHLIKIYCENKIINLYNNFKRYKVRQQLRCSTFLVCIVQSKLKFLQI